MSDQTLNTRPGFREMLGKVPALGWQLGGAAVVYGAISYAILSAANNVNLRMRFTLDPLVRADTVIQIHVAAAMTTLVVGVILLCARKGFRLHKQLGWTWVVAMGVTALSSFFITGIFQHSYSPIHALSAWTMISLPMGIAAIRRRDVARHRKTMTGMFVGGIGIAGLFSFLPGRLMWTIFFAT